MKRPFSDFPIARTRDPDQAEAILSRELNELRLRSVADRKQFDFEMNGIHLGRSTIAYNRFGVATDVDAGIIENSVIVSVSIDSPTILYLDGQEVGPDEVAIVSPGRRLIVRRSPDSGVLFLRADLEAIENRIREWTGQPLPGPLIHSHSVKLDSQIGARFRQLLDVLIGNQQLVQSMTEDELIRKGMDELVLNSFLTLPSNYIDAIRGQGIVDECPRLLSQAEEFMRANSATTITVSDIADECGCSHRTLYRTFRRYRNCSPMEYLTRIRLEQARQRLREIGCDESVTSIAIACGFSHMGRFARLYRMQFGESPSKTKRRNRR